MKNIYVHRVEFSLKRRKHKFMNLIFFLSSICSWYFFIQLNRLVFLMRYIYSHSFIQGFHWGLSSLLTEFFFFSSLYLLTQSSLPISFTFETVLDMSAWIGKLFIYLQTATNRNFGTKVAKTLKRQMGQSLSTVYNIFNCCWINFRFFSDEL